MKNKWAAMLVSMAAVLAMPLAHAEGEVARSIVTSGVTDREPVDDLSAVPAENSTVMFFTELRNMEGQTIKHRWMHGGEQMAEVSFNVGGPRWRIWSSKNMVPEWSGDWKVEVIDGAGNVAAEKSFTYGMAGGAGMEMPAEGHAPMSEEMPMSEEKPMAEEQAPAMESAPAAEEQGGSGMAK